MNPASSFSPAAPSKAPHLVAAGLALALAWIVATATPEASHDLGMAPSPPLAVPGVLTLPVAQTPGANPELAKQLEILRRAHKSLEAALARNDREGIAQATRSLVDAQRNLESAKARALGTPTRAPAPAPKLPARP